MENDLVACSPKMSAICQPTVSGPIHGKLSILGSYHTMHIITKACLIKYFTQALHEMLRLKTNSIVCLIFLACYSGTKKVLHHAYHLSLVQFLIFCF